MEKGTTTHIESAYSSDGRSERPKGKQLVLTIALLSLVYQTALGKFYFHFLPHQYAAPATQLFYGVLASSGGIVSLIGLGGVLRNNSPLTKTFAHYLLFDTFLSTTLRLLLFVVLLFTAPNFCLIALEHAQQLHRAEEVQWWQLSGCKASVWLVKAGVLSLVIGVGCLQYRLAMAVRRYALELERPPGDEEEAQVKREVVEEKGTAVFGWDILSERPIRLHCRPQKDVRGIPSRFFPAQPPPHTPV